MEGRFEETLKRERPEATEGEEMEEPFYEMVTEAVTNIGTIRKGAAETFSLDMTKKFLQDMKDEEKSKNMNHKKNRTRLQTRFTSIGVANTLQAVSNNSNLTL